MKVSAVRFSSVEQQFYKPYDYEKPLSSKTIGSSRDIKPEPQDILTDQLVKLEQSTQAQTTKLDSLDRQMTDLSKVMEKGFQGINSGFTNLQNYISNNNSKLISDLRQAWRYRY
jgi:hypothetical protein